MKYLDLTAEQSVKSSAVFSPCRTYRYSLRRTWDESAPPLVFIGLNPSTADETKDDPTIRRCIGFAKREGCGGLVMLNLFAFRSTDPDRLAHTPDPIGPDNDSVLSVQCKDATVVAAWGVHGNLYQRDRNVFRLLHGNDLRCLGLSKNGHPRHPLYIKADAPLIEYKGWRR